MTETKDDSLMWRVRAMTANHEMFRLVGKVRWLVRQYGVDGARDYLHWQLRILADIEKKEGGDSLEN